MPTYTLRTRILGSTPYKNIYDNNYDSYDNNGSGDGNNYWILIFLLIVLTLVAIFVGSIYNTQGYYHEGFEDGSNKGKTLVFFGMEGCRWCNEFKEGAWKKLEDDMKAHPEKYSFKIQYVDIGNSTDKFDDLKNMNGVELGRKYGVKSAPTLILINNSDLDKFQNYEDDRNNIEQLTNFGNKN